MPRIRTIKPEFWGDEKLAPMPPIDRLVFLGLLSFADDAGRLVDNVKAVDGFVFPHSDDSSRESLARLADSGRILRYTSDSGQALIQITNWKRHQKIDHASKYVLPAPPRYQPNGSSRDPREDIAKSSRLDLGPTTKDLTTPSSSARANGADASDAKTAAWQPSQEAALAARFETDADRTALAVLLAKSTSKTAVAALIAGLLDGIEGRELMPSPRDMGRAIHDFNANGADWNAALFRKYVRRALNTANEPEPSFTAGASKAPMGPGERSYLAGKAALEDL